MSRPAEGILATQKIGFYFICTLKFPGMTKDTPKILKFLWEVLSWFSIFLPFHMSLCFFKTAYDSFHTESIDTVSNIVMQGVWLFISFITVSCYKVKSNELEDIIRLMENSFQWRSPRGRTYVDMTMVHRYSKYMSIFWQIIPPFTVVFTMLRPLFKRPVELPMTIWYPIDHNNRFEFIVTYILQAWAQMVVVCGYVVGSSFVYSFCMMCAGQFNILRCSLKNLIYTSGVYKKFPETLHSNSQQPDSLEYSYAEEKWDDFLEVDENSHQNSSQLTAMKCTILSPAEIKSFKTAFVNCVEHHRTLLRLCSMMEEFLNFMTMFRVLELVLQMCFMAFVFFRSSDRVIILYGVLAAMDMFFITYPTEHIRDQNRAVGQSLFMGPWYLVSQYFRNDFLILMIYSQQSIYFTAGKMLIMDADRLRQALTTAFSIYTLLSSFDEG